MRGRSRRDFLRGAAWPLFTAVGARGSGRAAARTELREVLEKTELGNTHEHTYPEAERLAMDMDLFTMFSAYSRTDLNASGLRGALPKQVFNSTLPLRERWRIFEPYWEKARNTGYCRIVEIALRDLYGAGEINERTCEALSERIRAANRKGVTEKILREKSRNKFVVLDDKLPEPAMPELDLYVIARRFDRWVLVSGREDLAQLEKSAGASLTTLAGLEKALEADFENNLRKTRMAAVKTTLAYHRPLFFRKVTRAEAERGFEKVAANPEPAATDSFDRVTRFLSKDLQDYMFHRIVQLVQAHRLPMQIHTGIQAGQNVIQNANPLDLTNLFQYYPDVVFDLFHSGYPFLTEAAAAAKQFDNVYVDMCWMHIISPSASRRMLHEYLDTLPSNKVLGFGGDVRLAEHTYGHGVIARDNVIRVLEAKVADGDLKQRRAIALGKRLLCDNAAELFYRAGSA